MAALPILETSAKFQKKASPKAFKPWAMSVRVWCTTCA